MKIKCWCKQIDKTKKDYVLCYIFPIHILWCYPLHIYIHNYICIHVHIYMHTCIHTFILTYTFVSLMSVIISRCHPRFSRMPTTSPTTTWSGWWRSMCPFRVILWVSSSSKSWKSSLPVFNWTSNIIGESTFTIFTAIELRANSLVLMHSISISSIRRLPWCFKMPACYLSIYICMYM